MILTKKAFNDGLVRPYIVKKEGKKQPEGNFSIYYYSKQVNDDSFMYSQLRFSGKVAWFRNRKLATDYARYRLALDPIKTKFGIAKVKIHIPETTHIGPLPYKHKGKLVFPVGTITGAWTFHEIRLAVERGAKIKTII